LYESGVDTAGINIGLIALLLNFAVIFSVSRGRRTIPCTRR
jgi:hypothetical protein